MSVATHAGSRGSTKTAARATTIAAAVATANIAVGQLIVVRVGVRLDDHPSDTANGATNYVTGVTDAGGNSYTKIGESSFGSASSAPGTTVAMFVAIVTTQLTVADLVTATFDASRRGRLIALNAYDVVGALGLDTVAIAKDAGSSAWTITGNATNNIEHFWLAAGFNTDRTVGKPTVDTDFTTDRAALILDNGFDDSGTLWGQYRERTSTTETWNGTSSGAADRNTMILAAFYTIPPAEPVTDLTVVPEVESLFTGPTDTQFVNLGAGASPRVVLDFLTLCLPGPWVQLFYRTPTDGTVRRDEQDRFQTLFTTPMAYDANRKIEEAIRTRDRRITVVHSLRDPLDGTVVLERLNSAPYPDAIPLPPMPRFVPNVGVLNDLYWRKGQLWRDPVGATTEDMLLRLSTSAPVDAIEVQARDGYPGGYQPAFDYDQQEYAPMGGLSAGEFHDFTIEVTHGGISMQPSTFRARSRTGDCYSRWRYWIVAYEELNNPTNEVLFDLVNCGHDILVTLPPPGLIIYPFSQAFRGQNICEGEAPPEVGELQFLEGGFNPQADNPFLWQQSWIVAKRSRVRVGFQDENGDRFDFYQYGGVFSSVSGAGGWQPYDLVTNGNQIPEQFP